MALTKYPYNTNLAKGTSFINETLSLIEFYEESDTKQLFLARCITANILDKSTEHRTRDIICLVFFDRFWKGNRNVILNLKELRQNGLSLDALKSLLYIYMARANRVFYDFVIELSLTSRDEKVTTFIAERFILKGISIGMAPSWSDSMIKRVSSYLISCLKDFDLLNNDGYLKLGFPDQKVVSYLLHELHFEGKRDDEITRENVWGLLGLTESQVIKEMEKVSFRGTFIFQYSGEILKIGWNYDNMEEFLENECR
jgi:hypothetical protein